MPASSPSYNDDSDVDPTFSPRPSIDGELDDEVPEPGVKKQQGESMLSLIQLFMIIIY